MSKTGFGLKNLIDKITHFLSSSPLFLNSFDYKLLSKFKQSLSDSQGILIQYLDLSNLYSIDYKFDNIMY